jgi:Holliday junction resolvase RusA-like endonuclease
MVHHQFGFVIPIRPLSANARMNVVGGRFIKSHAARVFEREFAQRMTRYCDKVLQFKKSFSEDSHALALELRFFLPWDELMTKSGRLQKRTNDVDNMQKITIDSFFKYLGVDDSFITLVTSQKIPSTFTETEILLSIVDKPISATARIQLNGSRGPGTLFSD